MRELRSLVRTFVASQSHDEELRLHYLHQHHPELARPILERTQRSDDRDSAPLVALGSNASGCARCWSGTAATCRRSRARWEIEPEQL